MLVKPARKQPTGVCSSHKTIPVTPSSECWGVQFYLLLDCCLPVKQTFPCNPFTRIPDPSNPCLRARHGLFYVCDFISDSFHWISLYKGGKLANKSVFGQPIPNSSWRNWIDASASDNAHSIHYYKVGMFQTFG